MRTIYIHLIIIIMLCISGWGPFSFFTRVINVPVGSENWVNQEIASINSQAANIDPAVLKLGLVAYIHAYQHGITAKKLLTIIDYSKPSTERRLYVIDLIHAKVLFNTWVTHGKNSGQLHATSFSNSLGSLKSSIGVFLTTGRPYTGSVGYALRLAGLEPNVNDHAMQRNIVVHGAWYADPKVIRKYGLLGRSWGCPAVSEKTIRPLINTIKDRTLVVVYYRDRNWLNHSAFLAG